MEGFFIQESRALHNSFRKEIQSRNFGTEILKTEQPIGFEYFEYFKKEEVQSEMS